MLYILEEEPDFYDLVQAYSLPFKFVFLREVFQPLASLVVGGTIATAGVNYFLGLGQKSRE